MKDEVDKQLQKLGKYGRWQFYVFFCIAGLEVIQAWHSFSITFQGAVPDYHCSLPDDVNSTEAIPPEKPNGLQKCEQYVNFSSASNETEECSDGYWYNDEFGNTIVTEWDLVCDRADLVEFSSTLFFLGKLCGALVFPPISDFLGRKTLLMLTNFCYLIVATVQVFSNGYVMFVALRFGTGFCEVGGYLSMFCLLCESVPPDSRAWVGTCDEMLWSVGIMTTPLIALAVDDWRKIQIIITVPLVLTFLYYWILPESVHWLAAKNRSDKAEEVLQKASKMNKVHLDEHCLSMIQKQSAVSNCKENEKKFTLLDIYKTPKLRVFLTLMLFIWMTDSMVYYALSLGVGELSGNLYLNAFLVGAVELPAYLAAKVCTEWFGRIKSICAFHLIAGLALFSNLLIPDKTANGADIRWVETTLVMIGKAATSAAFASVYLYTVELVPTVVRNGGLGLCSSISRVGGMIAPLTITWQREHAWVQPILFGSMGIGAAIIILFFPETKGKVLPETLDEWLLWKESGQLQQEATDDNNYIKS